MASVTRSHRLLAAAALALLAALAAPTAGAQVSGGGRGGWPSRPAPDEALAKHALERLTYGETGDDLALIRAMGVDAWIRYQLDPLRIPESPVLLAKLAQLPPAYTPVGDPSWVWQDLWADHVLRARYTRRQLNEVLTDFWFNHFNVQLDFANGGRIGFFSSLAIDGSGTPVVAYWDSVNTTPHAAFWNGSGWTTYNADTSHPCGRFVSLAIDPATGRPAVAHQEWQRGEGRGRLRVGRFDGSDWTSEIVDDQGDAGRWASLAFDPQGRALVAYQDGASQSLKLARHDGTRWTTEVVAASIGGLYASLAVDRRGVPGIAWYDTAQGAIRWSSWTGTGWSHSTVHALPLAGIDPADTPAPARLLAAGIEPRTGLPAVAYQDTTTQDLRYATLAEDGWRSVVVDAAGDVGLYPSLAFDAQGEPGIAYLDRTGWDLKLARRQAGAWSVQTVDSGPHITGPWASLAFDAASRPLVSYYNGSTFSAEIQQWDGTAWSKQTVEALSVFRFVFTVWMKEHVERLRDSALGCFRDLLEASAKSPAMMMYLNNDQNFAGRGNENYARELLELHTIGVDGGYDQADVETVARALTGWGQALTGTRCDVRAGDFCYNHAGHDGRTKTALGRTFADDSGPGPATWMRQGEEILDWLALHPSTARFVCGKLIRKFVADEPPMPLWDACADTWLRSGGDIERVLETILFSPQFRDPAGFEGKVKTPIEYTVGMLRHLDADTDGLSVYLDIEAQGMAVFFNPVPTGYDERGEAWLSGNSLLQRWKLADRVTHASADTTVDPAAIARAAGVQRADAVLDLFLARLVRGEASPLERDALLDTLSGGDPGPLDLGSPAVDARLRDTVGLILGLTGYLRQ